VNHYIFKHGLSEEKILKIALDRVLEKARIKLKYTSGVYLPERPKIGSGLKKMLDRVFNGGRFEPESPQMFYP
jgi:hypothetical protein